jgi:hypothetical protein
LILFRVLVNIFFICLSKLNLVINQIFLVTTKVKGQGFIPINKTLKARVKNQTDLEYYEKLFSYDLNSHLHILDTAG